MNNLFIKAAFSNELFLVYSTYLFNDFGAMELEKITL